VQIVSSPLSSRLHVTHISPSPPDPLDPRRARKNFAKLRGRRRRWPVGGIDPVDSVDFVAQARLAFCPAGDERSDDEMRSYSAPFVDNRFHMPVKGHDFGFDSDFFHESPGECGGERFANSTPPGRLKWPSSGIRARRILSARLPLNTAAGTEYRARGE
jgi:hypothetical protein